MATNSGDYSYHLKISFFIWNALELINVIKFLQENYLKK